MNSHSGDWSIEATLPKPDEIETARSLLHEGTKVFLSTLPHVSLDQQIQTARIVRANGLEPVLHVAARYFETRTALVGYLARANREAAVSSLLVIGGDLESPRGEFNSALAVIESGLASDHGIARIGVAGYPEGHPKISDTQLRTALDQKISSAKENGHDIEVVTQFCFSGPSIIRWLDDFWKRWPGVPVRVGFAGPASAKSILRYALRCGVKTPKSGLGHKLTTASRLARNHDPADAIVQVIENKFPNLEIPSVHLFSFGGIEKTVRWMKHDFSSQASREIDTRNQT